MRNCQADISPRVNEICLKSSFVLMRGGSVFLKLPFTTPVFRGPLKVVFILSPQCHLPIRRANRYCSGVTEGRDTAAKTLISSISLSFLTLWDADSKSVNSSQWQLHGFCIINYLYQARHSNYHPDEYDILISHALILIALQHLTVSGVQAWWSEDSPSLLDICLKTSGSISGILAPISSDQYSLKLSVCTCGGSHQFLYGLAFLWTSMGQVFIW